VEYMEGADKSYRAEIAFGYAADTGDVYGEVIESVPHPTLPTEEEMRAVLARFVGEIQQRPPAYSAIKIGGQRAYDLARQGAEVEIEARTVTIHRLELVHVDAVRRRILIDVFHSVIDRMPRWTKRTLLTIRIVRDDINRGNTSKLVYWHMVIGNHSTDSIREVRAKSCCFCSFPHTIYDIRSELHRHSFTIELCTFATYHI